MLTNRYAYDGRPTIKLDFNQKKIKEEIDIKIKNQIYKQEQIDCIVCNGNKFELLSEKDRCGLYCPVVICKDCGLVQINPRFNLEAYDDYYKTAYRILANTQQRMKPDKLFLDQYYRAVNVYNFIGAHMNALERGGLVLEIGCSAGGLLKYFKEQGYDVLGIDIDEKYISFGRENYNLDLRTTALSQLKLSRPADIVILSHVLEHFLAPKQELSYLKKLMHPNSVIYIEVPGIKNMIFNCLDLDFLLYVRLPHLFNFTLDSLKNLLGTEGFSLIYGDENIKSLFKISDEKNTIKNVYSDTLNYLKRQEAIRTYLPVTPYKIRYAIYILIRWIIERIGLFHFFKRLYYKIINREDPKKK